MAGEPRSLVKVETGEAPSAGCSPACSGLGIEPGELSSGGRQQADVIGHRATGRVPP